MANHRHTSSLVGSKFRLAIGLSAVILLGEVVGGYLANSLALLSDAGHVFTDLLALSLSWYAVAQTVRPPSHRMTYGYHRVGILVAIVNGLTLIAIAGAIFYGAYQRFQQPPEVDSVIMFGVAVVGLVVNLVVAVILLEEQRHSLNVRSAFLHVVGDALGSVGVIAGGAIIYFTDWFWVDPLISVGIGLLIAFGSWQIIREGVDIFLEATPGHMDVASIVRGMLAVPGVRDIHDLHIWTISPQLHVLSCHVLVDDLPVSQGSGILNQLNRLLTTRFDIEHTTMQLESIGCDPDDLYCTLSPEEGVTEYHAPHPGEA